MINRTLKLKGEEFTVERYVPDGTDDHGDTVWEYQTESTKGLIESNRQPERIMNAAGEELSAEMIIYLDGSVEVYGAENNEKPSQIIRGKTGNKYRVLMAFPEGNGLLRCEASRVT